MNQDRFDPMFAVLSGVCNLMVETNSHCPKLGHRQRINTQPGNNCELNLLDWILVMEGNERVGA